MIKLKEILQSNEIKKIKKELGDEIPADAFIWNNYIGVMQYSDDEVLNLDTGKLKNGFEIEGWSSAEHIPVRPRENGIVVMVYNNDNGDRFWLHYPIWLIKEL